MHTVSLRPFGSNYYQHHQFPLFLVYIINTGDHVFCWVGAGASIDERKNGLSYASNYLNKTETPWLPISVVAQGKEDAQFNKAF